MRKFTYLGSTHYVSDDAGAAIVKELTTPYDVFKVGNRIRHSAYPLMEYLVVNPKLFGHENVVAELFKSARPDAVLLLNLSDHTLAFTNHNNSSVRGEWEEVK